jgi:DNA-binding NarL/FixJ family response regulator
MYPSVTRFIGDCNTLKDHGEPQHRVYRMRADERTRFVPVVMLSSSIRAEDVHMAYSLGANGYLDKMSHGAPWHEMVQTAARYWLRMNVAPNSLVGQEEDGFARRT